jgi:hypothetical protein
VRVDISPTLQPHLPIACLIDWDPFQGTVQNVSSTITGGIYRGAAAAQFRLNPIDSKVPPTVSTSAANATLWQVGPNKVRLELQGLSFTHSMSYACAHPFWS